MVEDVFGIVGSTQAGAYRVEEQVAEGGFAVVYRAYHEAFRAQVALKCLKVPETLGQQHWKEFLERFREEGELLFRLSAGTPAVVRPLHVGVLDGISKFVPFIALEWLDGETLDAEIARRASRLEAPMSLKDAVRLLTPVARALAMAHHFPGPSGEVCILHRDLKPENVFIAQIHGQRVAKILDFGIGKVKSVATQMVGHQSAEGDGLIAFTPAFGAPEQWLPKRFGQTGPWTDVWGLSLTLLAAISGRAPFDGDQAALLGSAIDPERRPTPKTEGVDVPDAVERVFAKAVAVDPRNRYTDVGVFWTDLHKAAGIKEGSPSLPPPAPAHTLGISLPPDPMAQTKPFPELGPPRAPSPSSGLEVPDLDLGLGAAAREPAPQPKVERRPAKITLMRDGSAISSGEMPGGAGGGYGGKMIEEEDEVPSRPRAADSSRAPAARPAAASRSYGDLEGVGLTPRAPPIRQPTARYTDRYESEPRVTTAQLRERLRGPVQLVIVGMVVMGGDFAYSQVTGELLRFGPVRPLWIAGPLVVAGIALAFVRFFQGAR